VNTFKLFIISCLITGFSVAISALTNADSNAPIFEDCKDGIWQTFHFRNQGECVNLYATGGMIWDGYKDFRSSPDQENPGPDSNGNQDVWHYIYNPNNLLRNPTYYQYLFNYTIVDQNWENWDDGTPAPPSVPYPLVGHNKNTHSLFMHPGYGQLAILRWQSPISGIVRIRGGFNHIGEDCGSGVAWFVSKVTNNGNVVTLANGELDNGSSVDLGYALNAEIFEGEFIDFILDPRGTHPGSASCDSTLLGVTIFGPVNNAPAASQIVPSPVNILGPEEIVFDWTTDRCETEDIPDLPARAFRDADDKVQLIATHFINRRMIGDDLASVVRDCNVIMVSDMDADPSQYNDREWISAVYTQDGVNIHALVHNEYQGSAHPGMCSSGNYFSCWYNSITYASSMDMGLTYTHAPAPQHRVANVPYKYVDGDGPYGIFEGSNIIRSPKDGYYYKLLHLEKYGEQDWGMGVMRTQALEDPTSWRCWDGEGFNASFIDPYIEENYYPADHVCKPVSRDNIEKMADSLTYNTFFKKYLLVGAAGLYDPDVGEVVHGFYYSLSDDLINWSPRQLLMKAKLWWTPFLPGDSYGYPSLIDPDDDSMNFEYTDKQVYLYYTRWHIGSTYDRDLVRVPIEFNTK
jgi:hypothetical protein